MTRRSPASLLFVAIILLASACGGSAPASPTAAPAPPTVASAASAPAAGAKATPASAPTTAAKSAGTEIVGIPTGGTKLEGIKVLKVGDVVELPASGLVVQVTAVRTSELDANRDWVLADMIIGNKGKEKESISSVVSFDVVTSDWKWYGLDLAEAIGKITSDVASGKEPALFDADVEPGKAVKGTARVPVPKTAKGLALVFHSSKIIGIGGELTDPYVFVSLGVRGDWPGVGVADDAPDFKAGTVYKVGDAFKLPKSGLIVKVNSAWERTESIKMLPIDADQKYVLADISVKQSADSYKAWPFEPRGDLHIVGAGDASAELEAGFAMAASAENTRYFSGDFGRGVVGARIEKSATGLQLKIAPSGPGKGEEVLVDLGLGGASAPAKTTGGATPTVAAKASPTAAAKVAPTPTPGDMTIPAELAALPLPSGFKLVPSSTSREAIGGEFSMAEGDWVGAMAVDDVVSFYKQALAKDYTLSDTADADPGTALTFQNVKDSSLELEVLVWENEDGDTQVYVQLSKS